MISLPSAMLTCEVLLIICHLLTNWPALLFTYIGNYIKCNEGKGLYHSVFTSQYYHSSELAKVCNLYFRLCSLNDSFVSFSKFQTHFLCLLETIILNILTTEETSGADSQYGSTVKIPTLKSQHY